MLVEHGDSFNNWKNRLKKKYSKKYYNPLGSAAKENDLMVARFLLDNGFPVDLNGGQSGIC